MKSSFIKLSVWIGLSALVACNDVDTPKYDLQATPELAPLAQPALVLNEASSGFIAETFSWSSGDYGFPAAPVYTLEIDNRKDFPDPIQLAESNADYVSVTVARLNMATLILDGQPGEPCDLFVRVVAKLTADHTVASSPRDITVTAYDEPIVYPKLYVPGNYQNWDIAAAPVLQSYRMNNRYEGYVDFVVAGNPDAAVEFKITTLPDWAQGDQYGDGGPGRLKLDGENISYTPQGYYLMQVDLDKLTYKLTPSEPVPCTICTVRCFLYILCYVCDGGGNVALNGCASPAFLVK